MREEKTEYGMVPKTINGIQSFEMANGCKMREKEEGDAEKKNREKDPVNMSIQLKIGNAPELRF